MRSALYRAALAALAVLVGMATEGRASPAREPLTPPPQPTPVVGSAVFILTALGGRTVLLQWRGVTVPGWTLYISRTSSSEHATLPAPPGGATATIQVLPDDVSWSCYTMNSSSGGTVTAYPVALCLVPGFATGAAPGDLTIWRPQITNPGPGHVNVIFWDPVPGAAAYVVLQLTDISIQAVPVTATTAIFPTEAGGRYCYAVFPVQGSQVLGRSDVVCGQDFSLI
jgi:hypothetical protein